MAPKPAAGGSPNGKGNIAVISGSAPGATTSTSRVDSLRSGRASGSGGTAGPMEEVKRDKTEIRVVEKGGENVSKLIPILGGKMKKRG